MKIALYYRHLSQADTAAFDSLLAALRHRGIEAVVVYDGDSVDHYQYLFSVGGDGTLLSSVQFVQSSNPEAFPPILGINFGHLGFLTTAGRDNIDALVDDLLAGRYGLERRTLLQVDDGGYALNEVFLHSTEDVALLRTHVQVDGEYVATYSGDGVIVATPTGSTAYSLSCGGPILTPTSRCFVITPISAHTLTLRPIIVPDTAVITLSCEASHYSLGIDSRRYPRTGASTVVLRCAPFAVSLIRLNTQSFFSAMRDKLMWGEGSVKMKN